MTDLANIVKFFQEGYLEQYQCGFKDGSWSNSMACNSGTILPAAVIAGFLGTVKLITTQYGVFSQIDTPAYEGPEVPGARTENVQVFYYILDTLSETFWMIGELTIGQVLLWYTAFAMIGYNAYYGTFVYNGIVGVAMVFAMVFWTSQLLIRLLYNLVNLDYLITKYDITTYSTINFYDPLSISSSGLETTDQLIWWEQLLFGNRRSQLYINIVMGIVFSLHPMTMILGWFFLFQVPTAFLFELVIYPFFPQFDTPYIPWTVYIEYVINGFEHNDVVERDAEKPNQKDKDGIPDGVRPEDGDKPERRQFMADLAEHVVWTNE